MHRGLEVRVDLQISSHIIIRNVPCIDRPHEMQAANEVPAQLAFKAKVASATIIPIPAEEFRASFVNDRSVGTVQ
jgi:hypothetical protein